MRKFFMIMVTLVTAVLAVNAQTRTVSGTVVDAANNEPLIGATVMPIGGGQGTATDVEGAFTLTVPANVKSAKISYVGYKEQTLALTNGMKVRLESSSTNLQDVVVVAYGTANKESLTGSVAVVGAQEIEDRPVTSVTSALEGNAPGVQVNNSIARPGSTPKIRIRGFNSFQSTGQSPLYVVDGIVYDGDIADINPADIESMSVLKDAASCALYGNRGANGVILINTKKAKTAGKVDVTLQVRQGMYNRGLDFYDTLGIDDWMNMSLRGFINGKISNGENYADYETGVSKNAAGFVSGYLMGTNIWDRPSSDLFVVYENGEPKLNEFGNPIYSGKLQAKKLAGYNDLKWSNAVERTGYRQEYNINAAGATDKFNSFVSVGYLKENGYMLATDFERFNGRAVVNYTPTSYLKVGANLAATYQKSELGPIDETDSSSLNSTVNPFNVFFNAPIQSYYLHDAEGNIMRDTEGKPIWNTTGLNKGNNVAWTLRLDNSDYRSVSFNGMLYGTAVIPYGFEFTVRGSMWRSKSSQNDYSNNIIGSQQGVGGLDLYNTDMHSYTFMQTLNWAHDYGLNHVDVLLNHENYEYGYEETFLRKSGQLIDDNYTVSNFIDNDYSSQADAKIRTESYLGRARYNYDQKYFAEVSYRRDGTSRFAKNNRWGNFWSVGASWIITKEKFMEPTQKWLDYLKLRFAYGSVGNDAAASAFAYMALYRADVYDNQGALIPTQTAGNDLKWEATKTLDVALEGSLFNDRFTFSVDFFDKRNSDLLYRLTSPWSAGNINNYGTLSSILTNIGEMQNYGWELQFGVDIIRNKNLVWDFNIDASFVTNKIKRLPNGRDIPGQALFLGKSIYEQYYDVYAGVDKVTGRALYEIPKDSPDYWVYDVNGNLDKEKTHQAYLDNINKAKSTGHYFKLGDKEYTDQTTYSRRQICGSALPVVYGSFGTSLRWKGLSVGLLFTYSLGGKSYNGVYQTLMSYGESPGALHKDILKSWDGDRTIKRTQEEDGTYLLSKGDILKNGVPIIDSSNSQYNNATSSRFLVKNDYLNLKNINVNYEFPKKWVSALKMQGLNLGVSIDNVFLLTHQKGFNPQYSFSGGQGANYVPARVYSFQLTAKF